MNICVLVKPLIDPAAIQWQYVEQQFGFVSYAFNSTDLHALQWACDYKEKKGAKVTAILTVDPTIEIDYKRLEKYNLDQCIVIKQPNLLENPNEAAILLAEELRKQPFDLILCGSLSEDAMKGTTPLMVSEILGVPSITHVQQIDTQDDRQLQVQRMEGRGIVQTYEIQLPAVIGVTGSIARKRYAPRYFKYSPFEKRIKMIQKQGTGSKPKVKVHKVSEPKPNIRYFHIPSVTLSAERRMLKIMGLSQGQAVDLGEKIAPDINEKSIHFISQKIQKWLKEG